METLGTWIGAFMSLALMSFALKENRVYRAAEHIYVGIAAAHSFIMGWENIQNNAIYPIMEEGDYVKLIFLILGILLYSRFFKGFNWLASIPLSILVGLGTGLTVRGTILADIINQIRATIVPLTSINNIIIGVGVITVLMYFHFTRKDSNVLFNYSGHVGRFIMMVAFGALFGNAAMGRFSLMIGRLKFLLVDWLGLG